MTLGPEQPGPAAASSVDEWFGEARNYHQAAEAAAREHLWRQAYQQAGQAVELALKGRIMRRERLNRWPDRHERRDLYIHDLGRLAALAGIQVFFEQEALAGSTLDLPG
jgi:HEPN domain-containing protein